MALDAGPSQASRPYFLLGSSSGTSPGIAIDGFTLMEVGYRSATLVSEGGERAEMRLERQPGSE